MGKYIDADKLIAQIQWMLGVNKVSLMAEHITADEFHGRTQAINHLFNYITSHQQEQPEVDLEKEISKWLEDGDITDTRFDDYDDSDIERTARHFYELGLNARKEE